MEWQPQGRRKGVGWPNGWPVRWVLAVALLQASSSLVAAQDSAPFLEFPLAEEFIVIPARVGEADLKLAVMPSLFTGVSLYQLSVAERAGISNFEPIRIFGGGAGGEQGLRGKAARGVSVEIAGTLFSTALLMVPHESSDLAHAFQGAKFDGYVGADLLNRMVVEVNYDEKRIRLIPPDQYAVPAGWSALPLRMRNGKPHLKATLHFEDRSVEAWLNVILKSNEGIVINTQSDPRLQPPAAARQVFIESGTVMQDLGKAARIPSLQLGEWSMPGPILAFAGERVFARPNLKSLHGYLGLEILRRFNFALDLPKQRILLQPNRSFGEEMDFDRCGLSFEFARPEMALKVAHVLEGSPAQAAGLAADDLILEIDGKQAASLSRYDAYRMLRGRPGEVVRLKYRRGSTDKEAALQKKILF